MTPTGPSREELITALAELSEPETKAVIAAARKQDRATKKTNAAVALQRLIAGAGATHKE